MTRRRFPLLTALHRPPSLARDFIGILQINPKRLRQGIVKTLMLATATVIHLRRRRRRRHRHLQLTEAMWAVATRCDPKGDVETVNGTMTFWLDPSSGGLTGKIFFDATKKERFWGAPGYPVEPTARACAAIANALKGHRPTAERR
jgi:hypothetical protein